MPLFEPQLLDDGTIQYRPIASSADIEHESKNDLNNHLSLISYLLKKI